MLLCLIKISLMWWCSYVAFPSAFSAFALNAKFVQVFLCSIQSPIRNVQFNCSLVLLHLLSFISTQENNLASFLQIHFCISLLTTHILLWEQCSDFWDQPHHMHLLSLPLKHFCIPCKATLHTHKHSMPVQFRINLCSNVIF